MSKTAILILAMAAVAAAQYQTVSIDDRGKLLIGLDSGKTIEAPKFRGQGAFAKAAIAGDRTTVGWIAMYPNEAVGEIAGRLVLYRKGRILHSFATEQVFWDWQFRDGGKRVAYSTGPTHGGAAECVLRDVDSGRVVARWQIRNGGEPPDWAKNLHQ